MNTIKAIGLASCIGLATWAIIGALAFAQTSTTQVVAIWTNCQIYSATDVPSFVSAMSKVWPEVRIVQGCIELPTNVVTRADYENWQAQLGLSGFQTLFITKASGDLFNTLDYDGYTFPQNHIGFLKQDYSTTGSFLASHELLHLALYNISNGNYACWSTGVHSHLTHPQSVTVSVAGGWTKTVSVMEHFSC